jgi:hypothetical protein
VREVVGSASHVDGFSIAMGIREPELFRLELLLLVQKVIEVGRVPLAVPRRPAPNRPAPSSNG